MQDDERMAYINKIVAYVDAVHRTVLNRPPDVTEFNRYANAIFQGRSPIDFFDEIANSRERAMFAKLFVVPGTLQSPIPQPGLLDDHLRAIAAAGPELPGIAIDRAAMVALWESLGPFLASFPFPHEQSPEFHFWTDNQFYGFGDAHVLHAMLRRFAPQRYVEIGSGFSSACAVDTIERHLDGRCELTFIEPYPERLTETLGPQLGRARLLRSVVEATPLAIFEELEAGDFLFIDSSHVLKTGSDVCFELFEILPRLKPGVIVHIHDVLWPFDYPEDFIRQQNRAYNEAYAVRAFLTNNSEWSVILFNDYLAKFEPALVTRALPAFNGNLGGAIWLEKRPPVASRLPPVTPRGR